MSSESETSDAQFTNMFFFMIGGLILLALGMVVLAVVVSSGVEKSDLNAKARDSYLASRLEPVGQITVGEAPASGSADVEGDGAAGDISGESVYQNTCAACHANGIAGAPAYGDSSAWSKHIAKGEETLYKHAIEGFHGDAGFMPAKGGNASLSDEQVHAAVDYMVAAVSDSSEADSAASDSAASDSAASDSAASDSAASDSAASDSADSEAADSEAADSEAADSEAADSDTATANAATGEPVYKSSCAACHASGVAGAPKLGDDAAWSQRIAQGTETLYKHAIEGFQGETGVMPPKGGFTNLSDDQVKAAVDYMVQQAQ